MTQTNQHVTDIAIIGGGISGLWLLNVLTNKGYNAVLLDNSSLGSGQTLASQGMIHGGVKYTLSGSTSNAFDTIADMPERWRSCLDGSGSLDLKGVKVLSDDYYMFSDSRLSSRLTAFFGSKALQGRINPVSNKDAPEVFQHPSFKGSLYRLQDIVIDSTSLVAQLANKHADKIYTGTCKLSVTDGALTSLELDNDEKLSANSYILTAGAGNGELIEQLGLPVRMQLRPLHQVMVKGANLPSLYAHAVTLRTADKPRITITTHQDADGVPVWYLGGDLAESGVKKTTEDQITFAKKELNTFLSWIDFDQCEFSTYRIDRAEPETGGIRPDEPYVTQIGNIMVCWPTKMTLVPLLGDMVLERLGPPGAGATVFSTSPVIATAPWEVTA